MNEYMSDEELLKIIADIENCDLVEAPPSIAEKVIETIDKKDKILEYKRFRNRVIAAVACILLVTISLPELGRIKQELTAAVPIAQRMKRVDWTESKIFGGLCDTNYLSEFMSEREE